MNQYICSDLAHFYKIGEIISQFFYVDKVKKFHERAIRHYDYNYSLKKEKLFFLYNLNNRLSRLFDFLLEYLIPINKDFNPDPFRFSKCSDCSTMDDECPNESRLHIYPICVSQFDKSSNFQWRLEQFSTYKQVFHRFFGPLNNSINFSEYSFSNSPTEDIYPRPKCQGAFYFFVIKPHFNFNDIRHVIDTMLDEYAMSFRYSYFVGHGDT
jgi:hypothetical protein